MLGSVWYLKRVFRVGFHTTNATPTSGFEAWGLKAAFGGFLSDENTNAYGHWGDVTMQSADARKPQHASF